MSDTTTPITQDGTTETATPVVKLEDAKILVNPETQVEHKRVEDVLGAAPRSKKGEPTVARSARFFFEAAKANPDLLVAVFDTQKIRAVKGADQTVLPVFSNVFATDMSLETAEKVFNGQANVVRMALDFANGVILSADAVTVRTTELAENPAFLEAKRFEEIRKSREIKRGPDSITDEWTKATKARVATLVAQELALRAAKKELDAEGEAEDNRGYDSDEKTESETEDESETPAQQQAEPVQSEKSSKPGRGRK